MNVSRDKLNECITLYLNDISDYDEPIHHELAEAALAPISNLILEADTDINLVLKETIAKASSDHKHVLRDFLSYMKEI